MLKKLKIALIVIAIISGTILTIILLQDRTKKLDDRNYKDINEITIVTDKANINIYKSEDEKVRVVIYGSDKDTREIIEGTKSLTISKKTGDTKCILNCKNEVNIYIPEKEVNIFINSDKGNITTETNITNIKITNTDGNVIMDTVNVLDITTTNGNIEVNTIKATNNSSIKTDNGNIKIDKIVNLKVDAKSESGSVVIPYIKDEQDFTLKIETNKGNIDIEHHENKSE